MPANDLMEPIYESDIVLLAEDVGSLAEAITRMQRRLATQNAPPDLINYLGQAAPPLEGVVKYLMWLKDQFPPDPPQDDDYRR